MAKSVVPFKMKQARAAASPMSQVERAQEYIDKNHHLENQRLYFEQHWKEITEYILPDHGFYKEDDDPTYQGKKVRSSILDDTAEGSLEVLASGMQGGLTSPARPWFKLGLQDDDLEQFHPVKEWLGQVERRMYRVFSRSNFYDTMHSVYLELGGFGTAAFICLEDPQRTVRFEILPPGTYCIALNEYGRVDTLYRRYWQTLRQLAYRFGEESLSETHQQRLDETPYDWVECLHALQPREDRDRAKLDNLNMPVESVYLEYDNPENIFSESGFQEFPVMVPRWKVPGSAAYGRGPGMRVLPNVKMLQEMQKAQIVALHKRNNPPVRVPSFYKGKLKTYPGGTNYFAAGQDPGGLAPLYEVVPDVDKTEGKIERVQFQIKEGLYEDLFKMISVPQYGSPPTATEIAERHEEKLIMLGPVIERQTHEALDPCIDRVFNIMLRRGLLPPPPQVVQGQELRVEYISLLAQAQKLVATRSIRGFVAFIADMAEAMQSPAPWDKIDLDKAIDAYHEAVGAPADVLVAEDEVQKIREMRRQAQLREQQRREIGENIEAMQQLSETSTDKSQDTALMELQKSLEGRGGS
jgi:hypothetical protein